MTFISSVFLFIGAFSSISLLSCPFYISEGVYLNYVDWGRQREMKRSMPKLVTQQSVSVKCQSKPPGCDTPTLQLSSAPIFTLTSPLIANLPNGRELKCL